ncbi:MAG: sugar ABC transporter substrate-binding protein [Desulfuromonadales bacterium]|nr:sugar ABC transporter substrate-binding protein [Desulfuromonadales bacterium]
MLKRLLLVVTVFLLIGGLVQAESIRLLMESVPDTRYIQELLPQFKAETGIDVDMEVISYIDMHSKLVPQLISPKGSYDAIVVDFYWVGEFTKAGWLMPLDDLVKRDNFDTGVYVPKLIELVGRVDNTLYMLPFYNYSMAIIYRKDMLEDPKEQAAFKAKYGMDLKIPKTWDEYWKQVEFFSRDTNNDGKTDMFGTVIQGQRGDCISMQWSNYLYALGGQYNDSNWNPTLNSAAGVAALTAYREALQKFSPPGSESYCFDEGFNVLAQGKAFSLQTFNIMFAGFEDPESSKVVGKVAITPNPGGGLNGAWGWAIPKSSPNKEAAWKFLKWVESYEIAKKRALLGGAPTQTKIFVDPEVVAARSYYPILGEILAGAQQFPVFTYTTQLVEEMGRELNLAATGEKDVKEALDASAEAFRKLLIKDGKLSK